MAERILVIGNKNYSSWSMRPWLALRAAGLSFREETIWLRKPDTKTKILAVSPSGFVPALIEGDLIIWDSLAICEYVAETAADARLWPQDPAARAVARAVSAEMHASFSSLRAECPMDIRLRLKDHRLSEKAQADATRVQAIWRDCRARFGAGGPYLFGSFSIADCFYAPVATRFVTYGLAMDEIARAYTAAIYSNVHFQTWAQQAAQESETISYAL